MSRLSFHAYGWEGVTYRAPNDPATTTRVLGLITDPLRDPFSGIGKPDR